MCIVGNFVVALEILRFVRSYHLVALRSDDRDLDLRHGHAGVLAGARRNVRESAAVRSSVPRCIPFPCQPHVEREGFSLRRMCFWY